MIGIKCLRSTLVKPASLNLIVKVHGSCRHTCANTGDYRVGLLVDCRVSSRADNWQASFGSKAFCPHSQYLGFMRVPFYRRAER
jgi:hypothetical protein